MISIDYYAYSNKLLQVHPLEKFIFAVITMVICLSSTSVIIPLTVFFFMAGLLIIGAGIPSRVFARLMLLPISFILIGVLTIAFSLTTHPDAFLFEISVGSFTLGIREEDLIKTSGLFFRSLATVSCLYFLSLTTPMVEIMSVLRKLRVPGLFLELMGLTYRFIFIFMETASTIQTSQSSRLGYITLRNSFKSISQLFSSLFIRSIYRSKMLSTSLISRCYTGDIKVLERKYPISKTNWILIAIIEISLILLNSYFT